jgi:hypothetical protein
LVEFIDFLAELKNIVADFKDFLFTVGCRVFQHSPVGHLPISS